MTREEWDELPEGLREHLLAEGLVQPDLADLESVTFMKMEPMVVDSEMFFQDDDEEEENDDPAEDRYFKTVTEGLEDDNPILIEFKSRARGEGTREPLEVIDEAKQYYIKQGLDEPTAYDKVLNQLATVMQRVSMLELAHSIVAAFMEEDQQEVEYGEDMEGSTIESMKDKTFDEWMAETDALINEVQNMNKESDDDSNT